MGSAASCLAGSGDVELLEVNRQKEQREIANVIKLGDFRLRKTLL